MYNKELTAKVIKVIKRHTDARGCNVVDYVEIVKQIWVLIHKYNNKGGK